MLARSPLFEKFSLQRNFQGLLSIVQLSRFLSFFPCDSFDILSNPFRFVKNFFNFFYFVRRLSRVSLTILPFFTIACQPFFTFFSSCQADMTYGILTGHHLFASDMQKLLAVPVVFSDNAWRRRRDLNPRAATNDLLPFQGSPFGQLGYFSKMPGPHDPVFQI